MDPEPDVVPAAWAAAYELLERDVLRPASRDEVRAHRRRGVRPVEEDAPGVAKSAPERNAVGLRPARRAHGGEEVTARRDDSDVDRVGGNSFSRVAHARQCDGRRQDPVSAPDRGQDDVGERRVGRQEKAEKDDGREPPADPAHDPGASHLVRERGMTDHNSGQKGRCVSTTSRRTASATGLGSSEGSRRASGPPRRTFAQADAAPAIASRL